MTLELLLQIFLEFFMELVGGLLTGASLGAASRIPWISRSLNTLHTAIMFFGAGFLIGWLSIWIFPGAFIRSSSLHGISLFITPTLAGLAMSAIGWIRLRQGRLVVQFESFSYGFIFAFAMTLIRLLFTK